MTDQCRLWCCGSAGEPLSASQMRILLAKLQEGMWQCQQQLRRRSAVCTPLMCPNRALLGLQLGTGLKNHFKCSSAYRQPILRLCCIGTTTLLVCRSETSETASQAKKTPAKKTGAKNTPGTAKKVRHPPLRHSTGAMAGLAAGQHLPWSPCGWLLLAKGWPAVC